MCAQCQKLFSVPGIVVLAPLSLVKPSREGAELFGLPLECRDAGEPWKSARTLPCRMLLVSVLKWPATPFLLEPLALIMPFLRFHLEILYAVALFDLKALLHAAKGFLISFIHRFWFAYLFTFLVTVMISIQLLM